MGDVLFFENKTREKNAVYNGTETFTYYDNANSSRTVRTNVTYVGGPKSMSQLVDDVNLYVYFLDPMINDLQFVTSISANSNNKEDLTRLNEADASVENANRLIALNSSVTDLDTVYTVLNDIYIVIGRTRASDDASMQAKSIASIAFNNIQIPMHNAYDLVISTNNKRNNLTNLVQQYYSKSAAIRTNVETREATEKDQSYLSYEFNKRKSSSLGTDLGNNAILPNNGTILVGNMKKKGNINWNHFLEDFTISYIEG